MANGNNDQPGVVAPALRAPAGHDPIKIMVEIAKDSDLAPADRTQLIEFAKNRFRHRRRMAYIALAALLLSLAGLFILAVTCDEGFTELKDSSLLISIEAFLTAIVGAYFGVSAWRPAS